MSSWSVPEGVLRALREARVESVFEELFEGMHVEGARHGQGYLQTTKLTLNRENGLVSSEVEVYTGGWAGDCPSGWGIVQYASGQVYRGEFLVGKRHGEGTLFGPPLVERGTPSSSVGADRCLDELPVLLAGRWVEDEFRSR